MSCEVNECGLCHTLVDSYTHECCGVGVNELKNQMENKGIEGFKLLSREHCVDFDDYGDQLADNIAYLQVEIDKLIAQNCTPEITSEIEKFKAENLKLRELIKGAVKEIDHLIDNDYLNYSTAFLEVVEIQIQNSLEKLKSQNEIM